MSPDLSLTHLVQNQYISLRMLFIKSSDLSLPRLSTESIYFPKDSFYEVFRSEAPEIMHFLKDAPYKIPRSVPATSLYRMNILP